MGVLLAIIIALTAQMPALHAAVTIPFDAATGNINITSAHNGHDILIYSSAANINIVANNTRITVTGFLGNITLDNVVMTKTAGGTGDVGNFMNITGNSQVKLLLKGQSKWTFSNPATASYGAGLRIDRNSTLTIESFNGVDADGEIYVIQSIPVGGAAIGTNYANQGGADQAGAITINSGTVTGIGGDDAAGIGGSTGAAGGYITINGGDVYARCNSIGGSSNSGAGIGAGCATSNSNTFILITGGKVDAHSSLPNGNSLCGAAIGAGNPFSNPRDRDGSFGYVIITGGTIRASVRRAFTISQALNVYDYNNIRHEFDAPGYIRVDGVDGVGIGGGSAAAQGTIIILPSADVSMVEGMTQRNGMAGTRYDAGNCNKMFYLNKAALAVGISGVQMSTKKFTIRTADPAPNYLQNADMFVYVPEADRFAPGIAARIGTTPSAGQGVVGLAGNVLNIFANIPSTFFTSATRSGTSAYQNVTQANSPFTDLNAGESYNSGANVYNIILPITATPNCDFKLSNGWNAATTAPAPVLNQEAIELNFGSADFNKISILSDPGLSATARSFYAGQTGTEWMGVRVGTTSNVASFTLEGPVVAPPAIPNAATLPVGSPGTITARLKPRLSVGTHSEHLYLTGVQPGGTVITRDVTLKVTINQHLVTVPENTANEYALFTATRPGPGTPTTTNSSTVRLTARAAMADIDGVKTVWYLISQSATPPAVTGRGGNEPTDAECSIDGWIKIVIPPGNYSHSQPLGDVSFPNASSGHTYHIHWYVETVNSYGSHGTISQYQVDNRRPQPALSKAGSQAVYLAPIDVDLDFSTHPYPITTSLLNGMFTITNASVSAITTITPGQQYKLTIQPNGTGDVDIIMQQNRVEDAFTNKNMQSNMLHLTLNDGKPRANFTNIDSVYLSPQSSISFTVADGLGGTDLYTVAGAGTPITVSNAHTVFELYRNGSLVPLSSITGYSAGLFTVTTPFTEGDYAIHIAQNEIKNGNSGGILDTIYRFKVLNLSLLPSGAHNFGVRGEGYPGVTPHTFTLHNNGSATATGLSVVLTGADAAAYTLNAAPFASAVPGGGSTTFTLAPKTGLPGILVGQLYTATVDVLLNGVTVVASCNVTFTVTKMAAPNAAIDYEKETLVNLGLNPDDVMKYSFSGSTPVSIADTLNGFPIPESWMNDLPNWLSIEKVDVYGGRSTPQLMTIPRRPAAPNLTYQHPTNSYANNGMIIGINDSMEYRPEGVSYWTPFPYPDSLCNFLEDLPEGVYQVRYRARPAGHINPAFASYITVISLAAYSPPALLREVNLPSVEGVTIVPAPGIYTVISYNDFHFSLTFEGAPKVVRTNRMVEGKQEVLTGTPNAVGGYDYVVLQVQSEIAITIGPDVAANAPVSGGQSVWAAKGMIYVTSPHIDIAEVYTPNGVLQTQALLTEGTTVLPAAPGVYIVVLRSNKSTWKVICQ